MRNQELPNSFHTRNQLSILGYSIFYSSNNPPSSCVFENKHFQILFDSRS